MIEADAYKISRRVAGLSKVMAEILL